MSWRMKYSIDRAQKRRLLQMELDDRGLSQAMLAEQAGVSPQLVSRTFIGRSHSPKVLTALRDLGISEDLICDPYLNKTKEKEQA